MAEHEVELTATEGLFQGLAKQNMLFHQCIGELVDNAIGANFGNSPFLIEIIFIDKHGDDTIVDTYVCDQSSGMPLEILKKALQPGIPATTQSRLNEHGFGLKNALVTLSGNNGPWKIWTRQKSSSEIFTVEGPFRSKMKIRDNEPFPTNAFLPTDSSTIIKVSVKKSFMQTVQGRGAPSENLVILRSWLIEHLGVMYRGYLELDSQTNLPSGTITVSIGTDRLKVPPVPVPIADRKRKYFDISLNGTVYHLTYEYGTLDEVQRDSLINAERAKYYYQKNQKTQGIDIRLGKRVIATMQFETIWKTDEGQPLMRHPSYNEFVGELKIPELPRGILITTNNKTDFNLDDENWEAIFRELRQFKPTKDIREKSEAEIRKKWMSMLKATNPYDIISDNVSVWPTGTKIDVYRKIKTTNEIIIYEIKVGKGSPQQLYQIKMYWDGLVLQGEQPKEGILLVEDYSTNLEQMANLMNQMTPSNFPTTKPGAKTHQSGPYNFIIRKHSDVNL